MRLKILDEPQSFRSGIVFTLIRLFSRHPVLDVIRLVYHRPDFYCPQPLTHEVMRGPSSWSIGDRELMAAFIARSNECEWCTRAHTAVATKAYGHEVDIAAISADLEHVPIPEALRATLRLLRELVREKMLTTADVRAAVASGVTIEQIRDALGVCFAFSITTRLANAFGFTLASQEAFDSGARYLIMRGYR